MVRISNLDIIKILWNNSRVSFVDIAKSLGVSETAIRKRVKEMEKNGIIRKFTVDVNPRKIGFDIDAIIGVDVEPEFYLKVISELKNMDVVKSLYSSSGDHMIMIECWHKDSNELDKFVRNLENMKGVTRVCPAIILEKLK